MKAGQWDRKSFSGTELYGKTLGLVGAGRIGGEVAKRARAFGMQVIAFDPFLIAERAVGVRRRACGARRGACVGPTWCPCTSR